MCFIHSPESVSNAVLKEDKSLVVYLKQVATVKVEVSLHKHISHLLTLSLLNVLGVAAERCFLSNFCHKQTGLSCTRYVLGRDRRSRGRFSLGGDGLTFRDFNTKSSGVFDWLLFLCVVPYEGILTCHLKHS